VVRGTFRRLLAGSFVLVVAACSGGPGQSLDAVASATPAAIASPSPTAAPETIVVPTVTSPPVAVASPTPEPFTTWPPEWDTCERVPYDGPWPARPLAPRTAVRVAVEELNLRWGPCQGAHKIGTLSKGTVLVVSDVPYGPVRSGGYAWYSVVFPPGVLPNGELQPLPGSWFPDGTDTDGGWIAAHDASDAFVTRLQPRCPETADLENVVAMLEWEWLECFDGPIVLEGTYGCGGCGGTTPAEAKPTWLADAMEIGDFRVRWGDAFEYQPVTLHFKPGGPDRPPEGSIIRATVHVDDPAATTCTFTWFDGETPFAVAKETATTWCRQRLVVDSYKVIGTDPDFPR
jgi:hypothetical protein